MDKTRAVKRPPKYLLAAAVASLLGGLPRPAAVNQSPQDQLSGLELVFEIGPVLQDRNGDGDIDFVAARLVLGQPASDGDVAAAANVAARLGFETSAMNLPLTTATDGIPIAIGQGGLARLGIDWQALGVDLEPGVGVVALVDGAVAIAGGDEAGTAAAATAFSARTPYLWSTEGPTLSDVVEGVERVLAADDIASDGIHVARFVVEAPRAGLRRLDVQVHVAPAALERAETALRDAAEKAEIPPADEDSTDAESENLTEAEQQEVLSLRFDGLRLLRIYLSAPPAEPVIIHVVGSDEEPSRASGRRPDGGNKADMDLSNLYTTSGFLGDSDKDLIPDRVDVMLSAASDSSGVTADLAARLALEATGVAIPIAVRPDEIDDPEQFPPLVLIGGSHPLVRQLVEEEKLSIPDLEPGQGFIRVVPDAFGEKTAMVIVGADNAGLTRAVRQVAERFPHVWERGKDRTTTEDVEYDLWRALAGRSPVGQAATALYKLGKIVDGLAGKDLESVEVSIYVEKADDGLADYVRDYLGDALTTDRLEVVVGNIDVQNAELLIDEEFDIPSEVDEFWRVFRRDVLPRVRRGERVVIQALLSEPPEVRSQIERQARDELLSAGAAAAATSVTVLSAYKQGYSWLYDSVRPALHGKPVDRLTIRFAEVGPPEGWPQQAMYTPTRWLLEIFPIDEVLARELGLDLEQIQFEKMPIGAPAYEVIATSPGGDELYRETFDPKYVLRPYFDRFPDYEMVRVTTGWITAHIGSEAIVDQRIVTDLERFWDHFQGKTLMQVYDYVMRISDGKPRASDAPHFGELRIDVSLSEPDYRVGVDNEQVASMEALHEEIYFATLHFFDLLGRFARGQALNYPGRVIPIVRPKSDGSAGHARITFTGFGAAGPTVSVTYRERGQRETKVRRDIVPVALEKPKAVGALVRAGRPGLEQLYFQLKVDFETDRRDEFVLRTSARNVDSRMVWGEQVTGVMMFAYNLRDKGMYREDLAYHDLGWIEVAEFWGHKFDPDSQHVVRLPANGSPAAFPNIDELLPADDGWRNGELVQWETPIPPPEAAEILAKMSTYPQATVYQVGESYLGKKIWAMDLMPPVDASHWSQAKASTLKPTVIYSARQHANEVSSTSHVLKLAELLLTDPAFADALNKVNVVIHPITNPDGAQLAYDLYRITPDHMLHAGYLGSLGVDVSAGQGDDDPIYPETKVRPKLWNTWLPDLFLNPHGYPSHEWVQIFSEYAGWVRNRATQSRSWWGMRGWFMPSFNYVDSPDFPDHKAAAFEIRDRITEKINAIEGIRALNRRAYDRYRRYAFAWDSENFKMDFSDSVLIYTAIKGSDGSGSRPMSNPRVTIWSGTTEAPDETAHGEWLQLVASAGLEWDKALLEYLLEGNHEVNRTEKEFAGGVSFKIHRPRPAKPADPEKGE
ncbi:MAG: hypothetical protein IH876_07050 [Gemmatimonadetes bacterium]|nr:hypothetical protein [Gemmatimonadota bacterium]